MLCVCVFVWLQHQRAILGLDEQHHLSSVKTVVLCQLYYREECLIQSVLV